MTAKGHSRSLEIVVEIGEESHTITLHDDHTWSATVTANGVEYDEPLWAQYAQSVTLGVEWHGAGDFGGLKLARLAKVVGGQVIMPPRPEGEPHTDRVY
jgi:hypothetical protein